MGYPIPIPYIRWFGMMKSFHPMLSIPVDFLLSDLGSIFFGPMQVVFLLGCDMMGYDGIDLEIRSMALWRITCGWFDDELAN